MENKGILGNAKKHLKNADKVLAKIIAKVDLKERKAHKRYFESFVRGHNQPTALRQSRGYY